MNAPLFFAGDRVIRSAPHLAPAIAGSVAQHAYGQQVAVRWDDGSFSWGIHFSNLTREA